MSNPIQHRYDFVYFFDVTDGNPNGDPDAGNLPRVDAETGQGLVTDVCLKRKVRNYVALTHGDEGGYDTYVKERAILNRQHARSYAALDLEPNDGDPPDNEDDARKITAWMCKNFFDIRAFGAVMETKVNAGKVRGPIQLTIARSIHPIISAEFTITRCAVTTEADSKKKDREMGRKFTVPYGLYRGYGYINATLADPARNGTGFSEADLDIFKSALNFMFENDRSAARGLMTPVRCIAFRHENRLGNARADQLFDRVSVRLRDELLADNRPPRSKHDYSIHVDQNDLPAGITVEEWVATHTLAAAG